ncbi:tyrosine-type recombinase/integrase [Candidatus Omnitrophota bacterium]
MAGVIDRGKSWRIWWMEGECNPKTRRDATLRKINYPSKREAKKEANRREIEQCQNLIIDDVSFKDYAYKWLEDKHVETSTHDRYMASVNNFNKFLLDSNKGSFLRNITVTFIQGFINSRSSDNFSNAGINSDLRTIRQILKKAEEEGYFVMSPMNKVKALKEEKKIKDLPSKDEVQRILKRFKEKDPLYLVWMYFEATRGWRRDELRYLKVSDIDLPSKILNIRKTKMKVQRRILLNKNDCSVLKKHMSFLKRKKLYNEDGYLFPSRTGNLVNKNLALNKLKRITKELGIKKNITNHSFRHYIVTTLLNKTANIEVVKAITGHKDTRTILEHYTHAKPEMVKQGLEITKINI